MNLNQLTIITIGKGDLFGLKKTVESLSSLIELGAKNVIVTKEIDVDIKLTNTLHLKDLDNGLYNALNLGIQCVKTEYFYILHAGDIIASHDLFIEAFVQLVNANLDLILCGAIIGTRVQSPKFWNPKFIYFLIHPPHLGMIYKTEFVRNLKFREDMKIIADYYYLKEVFALKPSYIKNNRVIVRMGLGGLTTGDFYGRINILKEFIKIEGSLKVLIIYPVRMVFKKLLSF